MIASSSIYASRNAIISCSGIRLRSTGCNRGSIAARGRPRRVSFRPARSAASVATRRFSRRHRPSFAISRRARGLKRRSITWAPTTSSRTTTRRLLRRSPSSMEKFPAGQRAERAAWKSGWWAYKNADYGETVRVFEKAAASFPRSDYRPLFLYWSARSHAKLGAGGDAQSRLRLIVTDYGNSYYGRLAGRHLSRSAQTTLVADAVPAARQSPPRPADPANAGVIRLLLASELYDDALNELRFAQRSSGSSPVIDATIAWAYYRKGELRRAITLMRRAYPQHLTADQSLPKEILQVIFPLTYWDLIRKHAAVRNLDPYLVAALIGQESTFDPEIRSSANAWGLMQIVPSTGRQLARSLGIRRFTTKMLTNPEINVRMARCTSRGWCSSSAGPTTRSRATTPARTVSCVGRRNARASTRTSSSTTFRFRKHRTTSNGFWERPKTIVSCTARAADVPSRFQPMPRSGWWESKLRTQQSLFQQEVRRRLQREAGTIRNVQTVQPCSVVSPSGRRSLHLGLRSPRPRTAHRRHISLTRSVTRSPVTRRRPSTPQMSAIPGTGSSISSSLGRSGAGSL